MLRRFVLVGRIASASGDYLLDDVPGTSGRLDVLLRAIRAALLSSHGIRLDTVVDLVLLKGPCVVRIEGATVRFIRPDERSLAVLLKKVLTSRADDAPGFVPFRRGISLARGGLAVALAGVPRGALFVLDERAPLDLRDAAIAPGDATFVLGDHLGLPDDVLAELDAAGARRLAIGPVSVHADDAVAIVVNELDRRGVRP